MKTKIFQSFIIITAFTISCSEDYFDRYPLDNLTDAGFYSTKEELAYGVNDAYYSLKSAYSSYFDFGDLASDNAYNSKHNNTIAKISINESNVVADNTSLISVWSGSYRVISRANLVLTKMKDVTLEESVKKQFEGECKFLRALMYFNLVRIFGSVPLVLTDIISADEAFAIGQESADNIYNQIIKDLSDAKGLLPVKYSTNADIGRVTSLAAKTLLGKVYLTRHEYQKSYDILKEVIDANVHKLLSSYFSVFDAASPNNAEIIFAIQYARGYSPSLGNPFQTYHFPNEYVGKKPYLVVGNGNYMLTTSLVRSFEKSDTRFTAFVDSAKSINYPARTLFFSNKYIDLGQTLINDSGCDVPIMRYSDVLLMCAEAKTGLNLPAEALPFVSQVRSRAGLTTDNSIANSKTSMELAVEKERRVEFFSEAHRWFDLQRTGRLLTVMNAHFADGAKWAEEETGFNSTTVNSVQENELLFPIPQYQVELNPNKIKQNPGY